MAVNSHLAELSEKHQKLDRRIEQEIQKPNADTLKISELKRKKLAVKDEIFKLQADHSP